MNANSVTPLRVANGTELLSGHAPLASEPGVYPKRSVIVSPSAHIDAYMPSLTIEGQPRLDSFGIASIRKLLISVHR